MITDEILVLKEYNYKENDKILHALSKSMGVIQIMSKGCRKNNSHLIATSQLFAYSKCALAQSKEMYILTSAELIDNFFDLKNNISSFFHGSYILELISYVGSENQYDSKVFDMTIQYLYQIEKLTAHHENLTAAYELKLAAMLGYKPDFYHCLCCGEEIDGDATFFINEGGLFCISCANNGNGIKLSKDEIIAMQRILKTKFDDISSLEVNSKIINLIRNFLYYYIGKNNFTSLKLL